MCKSLKHLCVDHIIKTYYKNEKQCSSESIFHTEVVTAFEKLTSVLARQIFCDKSAAKGSDFEKFLWFLIFFLVRLAIRSIINQDLN